MKPFIEDGQLICFDVETHNLRISQLLTFCCICFYSVFSNLYDSPVTNIPCETNLTFRKFFIPIKVKLKTIF